MLATVTMWCAEQGALADDVQVARRSLEDVFLELTGVAISIAGSDVGEAVSA